MQKNIFKFKTQLGYEDFKRKWEDDNINAHHNKKHSSLKTYTKLSYVTQLQD